MQVRHHAALLLLPLLAWAVAGQEALTAEASAASNVSFSGLAKASCTHQCVCSWIGQQSGLVHMIPSLNHAPAAAPPPARACNDSVLFALCCIDWFMHVDA
jgi:hypothetical protein